MDERLIKCMVIGDGYLSIAKWHRNAYFGCLHSVRQKAYLLWKQQLLATSGLFTRFSERADHGSALVAPTEGRCEIKSRVHPQLTALYERLYPKGRGFSDGILDDLDEFHLAIIFMDDGGKNAASHTVSKEWRGRKYTYEYDRHIISFTFHLQSSGTLGCGQFCDWLLTKFGVEARIAHQVGHPIVRVYKTKAKERLRDAVSPHLIPPMRYKVEGRLHARPERLSEEAPTAKAEGDATV